MFAEVARIVVCWMIGTAGLLIAGMPQLAILYCAGFAVLLVWLLLRHRRG